MGIRKPWTDGSTVKMTLDRGDLALIGWTPGDHVVVHRDDNKLIIEKVPNDVDIEDLNAETDL